ncbi:MAG: hypothetical protein ABW110_08280 [Steroidobacteraceae bacterium]
MRARKFECGLLVLSVLFGQLAVAEPGMVTHGVPVSTVATADVRPSQVRILSAPAQSMPRVEEIQFAGLSPASDAQAATLDGQSTRPGSSKKDLLALILVAAMLVSYQLFRKHRLLRQQPFSL